LQGALPPQLTGRFDQAHPVVELGPAAPALLELPFGPFGPFDRLVALIGEPVDAEAEPVMVIGQV
jgi:hypothetical protein